MFTRLLPKFSRRAAVPEGPGLRVRVGLALAGSVTVVGSLLGVEHTGVGPGHASLLEDETLRGGQVNSALPFPSNPPRPVASPDITQLGEWRALPADVQARYSVILSQSTPAGAHDFAELLTTPGSLAAQDRDGHTLADDLYGLAVEPFNPALEPARAKWLASDVQQKRKDPILTARSAVLDSLLRNLADPAGIEQLGNLCGPGAAEIGLTRDLPAEYARIIGELVGTSGRAALPGGKSLRLHLENLDAPVKDASDPFDKLATSIFEPAAEDLANGASFYNAAADRSDFVAEPFNLPTGHSWQGTPLDDEARLLSALHETPYVSARSEHQAQGYMVLGEWLQAAAPIFNRTARATLGDDFLESAAANKPGAPTLAIIPAFNDKGVEQGLHWVVFGGIREGRVYLYNPWGRGAAGSYAIAPIEQEFGAGFRVEDPESGLMSVPMDFFFAHMKVLLTPRSRVQAYDPRALAASSPEHTVAVTAAEVLGLACAGKELLALRRRRKAGRSSAGD